MNKLKSIRISGWKSIKDSDIELRQLNVFIGANGCGKSNLVSFFKLLNEMISGRLQDFIATSGGANSILHYGAKVTPTLKAYFHFEPETGTSDYYRMILKHTEDDRLKFEEESFESTQVAGGWLQQLRCLRLWTPPVHFATPYESVLVQTSHRADKSPDPEERAIQLTAKLLVDLLGSCRVYHFHDTSSTSGIRLPKYIDNNRFLMSDGGNLAAMLHRYREVEYGAYHRIVSTIRQVAPFFGDFDLEPDAKNPENIRLNWREKGIDERWGPDRLSDGALRAMALITLLLQPEFDLPTVIVIDEPELGLHPYAIGVFASLVKRASQYCQVIVATQSPTLLDEFEPEDIVVVDRESKESTFRRLDPDHLNSWLEDYSFSEVWEKNVFGGGPH